MDLSLVIPLLAFFGAVQLCVKYNVKPVLCSMVAVIFPFLVNLVLGWIRFSGGGVSLAENLFSVATIVVVLCQFAVAMLIFRKLQENDSYKAWFALTVGGSIIVILIIPYVINVVLGGLMR